MKKLIALLLTVLLTLTLAACGGENAAQSGTEGQPADGGQFGGDLLERIQAGEAAGWQEVDQSEDFGIYRTEEELLAILESGELYTYETTFEEASEPLVVEAETEGGEDFTYAPGEGVSGVFSEAEAAKAVKGGLVYVDWKSMMDPEALAEWEASDPNDPEMLAEMEELNRQGEEAQQQLDEVTENIDMDEINRQMEEAMKELEGLGLGGLTGTGGLDLGGLTGTGGLDLGGLGGLSGLLGGLDLSGLAGGLSDSLTGGGYEGETYGWPDGLRVYQGGAKTSCAEGSIAIYATTMEEMRAYVNLLKQDGFVYMDFYDSGMTEEQMLKSVEQWHGTNGTLYLEIGYGFGDLGLGYGESGTVTIEYTYKKPSWDDIW